MGGLSACVRAADWLNEWVGRVVAWMTVGTVIGCFATVYLRYALGTGFIWLQEVYVWQHACVFLVGAGYTLLHGGHVRVDIFYARMTTRAKAWIDILGTFAFMTPFLWVIWTRSWGFFWTAYQGDENSQQPDGLANVWLLKSTLLMFVFLVGIQGLALVARSVMVLLGRDDLAAKAGGH